MKLSHAIESFQKYHSFNSKKDLIDEIIFKTDNPRNRIMMELMPKGGMRIYQRRSAI